MHIFANPITNHAGILGSGLLKTHKKRVAGSLGTKLATLMCIRHTNKFCTYYYGHMLI